MYIYTCLQVVEAKQHFYELLRHAYACVEVQKKTEKQEIQN